MPHPLILALFDSPEAALPAARAVRDLGVDRGLLSIVARTHQEEGALAERLEATPGVEIEDSRIAARLGELGGQLLAAIAVVMPGIGPIVAAGPLSAELGEAVGHVAGGVAWVLSKAGLPEAQAARWQGRIEQGAVLLGVHVTGGDVSAVRAALERSGAGEIALAQWE